MPTRRKQLFFYKNDQRDRLPLKFFDLCLTHFETLPTDDLQKEKDEYDKVKQDYDQTIAELAEM